MLVQALEELRQTLSRKEQQAVFREDMVHRDTEDLQRHYQETNSRRAEAWDAVERSLNSRLQEVETKAAATEERERSVNELLPQTLSQINVLQARFLASELNKHN